MKDFGETVYGDQTITRELDVGGVVEGNVSVHSGGTLRLTGMVTKDVNVYQGGCLILRGMVVGSVTNLGGAVEVYGTIVGQLHERGGKTFVSPNAAIQGR